jgi:hypothetical protein
MEQVMHRYTWMRVATPVLCAGLVALYCEHVPVSPLVTETVRVLFGVVACAAIVAVLITGALDLANESSFELHRFARLVSRWVYILVYVMATVRVGFYLLESSRARGMHDLHPVVRSPDDFQTYLWSCLIPLWLIRAVVLSDRFRVISRHRAALTLTNVNRVP